MSENKPIVVLHEGVEIKYNEATDRWEFTLRGRDRFSESLAKAREAIDKPPPSPKDEEPFVRTDCWRLRYSSKPEIVTVTSLAQNRYGSQQVWITVKTGDKYSRAGSREKTEARELYPLSDSNDKIMQQITANMEQQQKLYEEREKLMKKLTPYTPPKSAPTDDPQ